MVDFDADVSTMETVELLEYQQALTRTRLAANDAGRRVQVEIDRRSLERAAARAAEDAELGAVRKPPAQQVFAPSDETVTADG